MTTSLSERVEPRRKGITPSGVCRRNPGRPNLGRCILPISHPLAVACGTVRVRPGIALSQPQTSMTSDKIDHARRQLKAAAIEREVARLKAESQRASNPSHLANGTTLDFDRARAQRSELRRQVLEREVAIETEAQPARPPAPTKPTLSHEQIEAVVTDAVEESIDSLIENVQEMSR